MLHRKPDHGERIYRAIKARALACGFGPGEPIHLGALAAQLGVSTTPIRAALNMLAAEGLVTRDPRKGFRAMTLSEDRFLGLYRLNQNLLDAAITTHGPGEDVLATAVSAIAGIANELGTGERKEPDAIAGYTELLFSGIAHLSGNEQIVKSIERINENLRCIRALEAKRSGGVSGELLGICELFLAKRRDEVVKAIEKYHARRVALLPELLAGLQR